MLGWRWLENQRGCRGSIPNLHMDMAHVIAYVTKHPLMSSSRPERGRPRRGGSAGGSNGLPIKSKSLVTKSIFTPFTWQSSTHGDLTSLFRGALKTHTLSTASDQQTTHHRLHHRLARVRHFAPREPLPRTPTLIIVPVCVRAQPFGGVRSGTGP